MDAKGPSAREASELRWIWLFGAMLFVASFAWFLQREIFMPPMGRTVVPTASSLLDGIGFEIRPGWTYGRRAPLQPILLAFGGLLGLSPHGAVVLHNCFAFALGSVGLALLCRVLGLRAHWAVLAYFAVFAPYYHLLRSGMPDGMVVAMSFFVVAALAQWCAAPSRRALGVVACGCAVASTTHYLALFTLYPLVGVVLLALGVKPLRERLVDWALFALVGCGPIGLWLLRNWLVTGYLSGMPRGEGERAVSHSTELGYNAHGFAKTVFLDLFAVDSLGIRRMIYGKHAIPWLGVSVALSLVLVLAVALLLFLQRERFRSALREQWAARSAAVYAAGLCLAYLVFYVGAIALLWSISNNDRLYTRFISPLYFFALLLLVALYGASRGGGMVRGARLALAALFVLTGLLQLGKTLPLLGDTPGKQLMATRWIESDDFWERWSSWDRPPPKAIGPPPKAVQ